MGMIYYFCTVKNQERHEVAAKMQRFFCPNLFVKNKRIECGTGNSHKVFALDNLTARNALSLLSKN